MAFEDLRMALRGYLLGHKCIVYTDNGPLSHWKSTKLGADEQRWAAEIDVFDHETWFQSGRTNVAADFLSRHLMSVPEGPDDAHVVVSNISVDSPSLSPRLPRYTCMTKLSVCQSLPVHSCSLLVIPRLTPSTQTF